MLTTHALTLATGIALGVAAGWHAHTAARAWQDYKAAKQQLPVLRATARALTRNATGAVLAAAVLACLALYLACIENEPSPRTT